MQAYNYIIVGGGLAGGRACEGIRRVDKEGSVALVTMEQHRPYQRPPLSKGYLTGKEGLDHVYLRDEGYYTQNRIDLLTGVVASAIDPGNHTVHLEDGQSLQYQKLLLATGGRPIRLPLPGSDLEGVFVLRTLRDCEAIQQAARSGKQALVLGGSFIGSEVASSLAQLGLDVTMVFPEARLLQKVLPEATSEFLHVKYAGQGVRILSGEKPAALEGDGHVRRARLESGKAVDADMVVMGVGIRLNTDLARQAGLSLDERGAVLVDEYLRTSNADIYAAGDIASWPDPTYGKRLRVEHWDVARQQGTRAGRNMAGEDKPYSALPYFYSDLFDLSFEAWGDLSKWENTLVQGQPEEGKFAIYYFAGDRLTGALAAGWSRDEGKTLQEKVQNRVSYAEMQATL